MKIDKYWHHISLKCRYKSVSRHYAAFSSIHLTVKLIFITFKLTELHKRSRCCEVLCIKKNQLHMHQNEPWFIACACLWESTSLLVLSEVQANCVELQNERYSVRSRELCNAAEKLILLISEFTFWMISIMNKSNTKLLILRHFVYKVIELVRWLSNSSAAVWIFIIFIT